MTEIPYKEISLLILGTLSTFLIWRVQHQKDKIKNIESQLSERKYQMYSELIHILFDVTNGKKVGEEVTDQQLLKRILGIKRDMFYMLQMKCLKHLQIGHFNLELIK